MSRDRQIAAAGHVIFVWQTTEGEIDTRWSRNNELRIWQILTIIFYPLSGQRLTINPLVLRLRGFESTKPNGPDSYFGQYPRPEIEMSCENWPENAEIVKNSGYGPESAEMRRLRKRNEEILNVRTRIFETLPVGIWTRAPIENRVGKFTSVTAYWNRVGNLKCELVFCIRMFRQLDLYFRVRILSF